MLHLASVVSTCTLVYAYMHTFTLVSLNSFCYTIGQAVTTDAVTLLSGWTKRYIRYVNGDVWATVLTICFTTLDQFREQMISYVHDMSQPQFTDTLQKSIEKEEVGSSFNFWCL